MRVVEHPILDELDTAKTVTIYFDGMPVRALEGEPVAAALMNAGIRSFRLTAKKKEKRGIFCAIGRCTDCVMVVDGQPNVRTCITELKEGMVIQTQNGVVAMES